MDKQITKNFRLSEFRCPCADRGFDTDDTWCHGASWPHRDLVELLQKLRDHFGKSVIVNSGCRCPRYNSEGLKRVQGSAGAPRSQHIRGTAADIRVEGVSPKEVAQVARNLGLYVIEYPTFVHVDIRNLI